MSVLRAEAFKALREAEGVADDLGESPAFTLPNLWKLVKLVRALVIAHRRMLEWLDAVEVG